MQKNRRRFLKCTLGGSFALLGATTLWVATSQRRAARWARHLLADARRKVEVAPFRPKPANWSDRDITVAWLGHASVLINFYGFRILTDPVLGSRVGVGVGIGTLGPKRFIAPALSIEELPAVDLVLLSHAHMDHFDLPTLRKLSGDVSLVTARATEDLLSGMRFRRVVELGWNERSTLRAVSGDLVVEAFEVQHWGQRWPSEKPRGYNGYLLRREGKAILFGGDTAYTGNFSSLRSQGPFELGIMPIGAYRPWIRNHCTPEQALEMANLAGAKRILPIHHQTFCLSEEPMMEPIERLGAALEREPERLAWRQVGESFVCPKSG